MHAYDSQIKDLEDQIGRNTEITRRLLEGISNQLQDAINEQYPQEAEANTNFSPEETAVATFKHRMS